MACGAVASRPRVTPSTGVAVRPQLLFADRLRPPPSPAAGATAEHRAEDRAGRREEACWTSPSSP